MVRTCHRIAGHVQYGWLPSSHIPIGNSMQDGMSSTGQVCERLRREAFTKHQPNKQQEQYVRRSADQLDNT